LAYVTYRWLHKKPKGIKLIVEVQKISNKFKTEVDTEKNQAEVAPA